MFELRTMAQISRHQSIAAQASTSRVKGLLSAGHSLALRRLAAWGLEVGLLVGAVALPLGLGEAVRQQAGDNLRPLNPGSSLVQGVAVRHLGWPRQRQVEVVPPLTNVLWFSALVLPMALVGGHIYRVATTGRSWPKDWLGLRIVSLGNRNPGYRAAILREGIGRLGLPLGAAYVIWVGSGVFPALPWLGGLAFGISLAAGATGFTNPSRRAIHDYLAKTRVLLLRGGQLPTKYQPEYPPEPDSDFSAAPPSPMAMVASSGLFPWAKVHLLTFTEEEGGLQAIVLSPLEGSQAKGHRPGWMPRWLMPQWLMSLSWPMLGGVAGGVVVLGLASWLFRPGAAPVEAGRQQDSLFLALVENLSLNANTFRDQQAAALALASSQDPRAVTLLVDLLAQTGDPAMLDTIQQALVTMGPPALPHLQRLNLTLANDVIALAPEQQLLARLRQRTVKRTLAKILVLHSGNFNGADLSGTNLAQVMEGPDTFTLVLEDQHLAGTQWHRANLAGARLRKAIFFDPGADGRPDTFDDWVTDFSEADLTEASLVAAQLRHANFQNASLLRTNLSNSQAHYADFSGANAGSAWWIAAEAEHSLFNGTSLTGADLTGAQMNHSAFVAARLRQAILAGGFFDQANFSQADLSEADLREASLEGANLTQANLIESQLMNTNLANANLEQANLQGAQLQGVILTGANLAGANLAGAQFWTVETRPTDDFIATVPDLADNPTLAGVDFSKALNLREEQLSYICQQGGLHPHCAASF